MAASSLGSWIDDLFQYAHVAEPANPITQGYGVSNSAEPGGWHHGVDVALPGYAGVYTPIAGTYDAADSGAYRTAIDVPGGQSVIFAHVKNMFYGRPAGTPIAAGTELGTVLPADPGQPFNGTYYEPGDSSQWYSETASHLHVEAQRGQGSLLFGSARAENPNAVFSAVDSTVSVSNPIASSDPGAGTGTMPNTTLPTGGAKAAGQDPFAGWPVDPLHWADNTVSLPNPAKIAGGVLSSVSRILLTALFAIGALALGLLLMDRLTGSNNVGKLATVAKFA